MTAIIFDTLAFDKKMIAAGFSEKQAEELTKALAEIIDDKVATRKDVLELKKDLLKLEERLMYKLTIRMGLMAATMITILSAIIKLA
jgi:hypothetical protein